jgi:hypothetical protein
MLLKGDILKAPNPTAICYAHLLFYFNYFRRYFMISPSPGNISPKEIPELYLQVKLEDIPFLQAIALGEGNPYDSLSQAFSGVIFGYQQNQHELLLYFSPQGNKYNEFFCDIETLDEQHLVEITQCHPVNITHSEWDELPKFQVAKIFFGEEPKPSPAMFWLNKPSWNTKQCDNEYSQILVGAENLLTQIQSNKQKKAQSLQQNLTVTETYLACPKCRFRITIPSRLCPHCKSNLNPSFAKPGLINVIRGELQTSSSRLNTFRKLILGNGKLISTDVDFEILKSKGIKLFLNHPVPIPSNLRIIPSESNALFDAQQYFLDLAVTEAPCFYFLKTLLNSPDQIKAVPFNNVDLTFYNSDVSENKEQCLALQQILDLEKDAVYLIQGPPGTGKTTVIAEAIQQLIKRNPKIKILLSSHSNQAVDDAAERLQKAGVNIFRLKAGEDVGEQTWERYQGENVVASTSNKAIITEAKREEAYDYIFLDEANKVRVDEAFPLFAFGKRVVMIGDHKQLPPVVEDEDLLELPENSTEFKLATKSLYELLWESALSENNKITLLEQHRMHPGIRHIVSQRFYKGKLRDGRDVQEYRKFRFLGNRRALLWIDSSALQNKERRTSGGSIYNHSHINICRQIVKRVNAIQPQNLSLALIGMYKEQVDQYRDWQSWTKHPFRVDTVDAFEGSESDIVIVDLVRSNKHGNVGFLSISNRINVAMSRAKRLLIIVGDGSTIKTDPVLSSIFREFERLGNVMPASTLLSNNSQKKQARPRSQNRRLFHTSSPKRWRPQSSPPPANNQNPPGHNLNTDDTKDKGPQT